MSIRNKIRKIILFIFAVSMSLQNSAISSDRSNAFSSIINKVKIPNSNQALLKWDTFLKDISKFHNNETILGIKMLSDNYFIAEDELESCCNLLNEKSKQYSSKWLEDLTTQFGNHRIHTEYMLITNVLLYLRMRYSHRFCMEQEKNVLYWELFLKKAILKYTEYFFSFYGKLDLNQKNEFIEFKKNVDLLNKQTEHFFYSKTIGSNPQVATFPKARLQEKDQMKSPVAQFLMNHPDLFLPFDFGKALDDLRSKVYGQ